ncbi:MAG: hypothetical protein HKN39_04930 [Flavobacteriales bacterium]|nr:hypothetical protein [Flavobacteriales bacterium]
MRTYVLILIWFLVSANACQNEKVAGAAQKINRATELYEFDHSGAFPVNMDLFGQSTSHMFQVIDEVNDEIVSRIKNIGPRSLRFPGGTGSNFYHFYEKGYGFNVDDVDLSKGYEPYSKMLKRIDLEKKRIDQGKAQENYAFKCLELSKELDVPVVLVTNMFSGNDKENMSMVDLFVENGIEVRGIELGNEYYFKAYTSQFPDCEEYVGRCISLVTKLRSKYPNIPVAVTAANPPIGVAYSLKNRFVAWNERLAQEDFYDAYIVHFYSKSPDCDELENIEERFNCARSKNLRNQQLWSKDGLRYFQELFGNDKKIWLTEYNVKNVFKQYGNTAIQALYNADLILDLMRNRSVDLAIYHNLLTSSYGFAMINMTGSGLYDRVATQTFKLFSHLNESYKVLPFSKVTKQDEFVEQLILYSEKENKYLCYVVNQGEDMISLRIPENTSKRVELHGFNADKLYSGMGVNAFNKVESDAGVYTYEQILEGDRIDLQPYSFSVIEIFGR